MMPVTKDQAQMLATLAVACRPVGAPRWDEAGVVAAVGKVKHLALADVTHAVIRAADSRDAKTPGVIANLTSPCWRERDGQRPVEHVLRDAAGYCGVCGEPLDDHRKQDHQPERIGPPPEVTDHIAKAQEYARQAIGDAKEARQPEPTPEVPASPEVDRLRAAKVAGVLTDDEMTREPEPTQPAGPETTAEPVHQPEEIDA